MPTLSHLCIYPVKSLRGIELTEAEVTPRGLRHDRRWMLVDDEGVFLTQRELPQLATFGVSLGPDTLTITHAGATLTVPQNSTGEPQTVRVWRDEVSAIPVGPLADDWLSQELGNSVHLVWLPDTTIRPTDPTYSQSGDHVSFADGFPYLIFGESSLEDLNDRLDEPVPYNRFRPNFVFSGGEPFEEDNWTHFRIGAVEFERVKPCARCLVTTTDQTTGQRLGPEPLRTLAQYRKSASGVLFGQNIIARSSGIVRVGDQITRV